uniref:Uncharacterized protein n=1 Tax=Glossina palpalis gambiensis TaxID=67801 RepID=A0A1B0BM77_9MUSC
MYELEPHLIEPLPLVVLQTEFGPLGDMISSLHGLDTISISADFHCEEKCFRLKIELNVSDYCLKLEARKLYDFCLPQTSNHCSDFGNYEKLVLAIMVCFTRCLQKSIFMNQMNEIYHQNVSTSSSFNDDFLMDVVIILEKDLIIQFGINIGDGFALLPQMAEEEEVVFVVLIIATP